MSKADKRVDPLTPFKGQAVRPGANAIARDLPRSHWLHYLLAVAVTTAALCLRLALTPWIGDRPFLILFVLPILFSAWLGGRGPGLLSTVLAALGTAYFVLPPTYGFAFAQSVDFATWLILIVSGLLISVIKWSPRQQNPADKPLQSTERMVQAAFGFALACLGVVGVISHANVARLVEDMNWVQHTVEVIDRLEQILSTTTDAETGARGYVLTGDESYLEPFRQALKANDSQLRQLRDSIADNQEQLERLEVVAPLIAKRLAVSRNIVELRQRLGLEAAQRAVATGQGKQLHDEIRRLMEEMKHAENELLIRRQDEAQHGAAITRAVIAGGSLLALVVVALAVAAIGRDFAGRRRAEAALRESDALMRCVLNSMMANIAVLDRHGTIVTVNEAWERFAKDNAAHADWPKVSAGANYLEVCARAAGNMGDEALEILAGLRGVLGHSRDAFTCEYACHAPNARRWFAMHVSPLSREEGGAVVAHLDITARKLAEEELLRSRVIFENVFTSVPGLLLVLTPGLKIVAASDAYLKATMTTREFLLGRDLFDAFPDNSDDPTADGVSNLRASLSRVLQTATADTMAIQKYDVRQPNGVFEERFWSPINSPVLGVDGRVEYIIHRVEDVTAFVRQKSQPADGDDDVRARMERMEAEIFRNSQELQAANLQLHAANAELEAFAYSVSHDLRAPLRGIDGWSLALWEDYQHQLDAQAREYLDRVRSETQRMGRLIDDLLELSRVTRADMEAETVDLSGLAHTVAASLRESQPERQVDIIIELGLTTRGDSRLLEIMLSNLLGNAFKFTGKRADARIEFGQTRIHDQDVFFVRDNGAGFDMAYASKLFGAFQRMHKAADYPGTGIGLATVQRIIHRHGGRVWAESKPNQGATFYFTLKEAP